MRASFASFWFAIEHFTADNLKYLNLGAVAGVEGNGKDGLPKKKLMAYSRPYAPLPKYS